MPSFSNDVKAEICSSITDSDKKYACLYGIILYSRHIAAGRISVHTESESFFELTLKLLKDTFGNEVVCGTVTAAKKGGGTAYHVNITDKASVEKIFATYSIDPDNRAVNRKNIVNNSLDAFLAGVFFVCGSITDPKKEYHLEFTAPTERLCSELNGIICGMGINAGKTERKNSTVLYIKDSENIEDILIHIGARQCTIDLINIKIYKDMRNKVNRIANCDNANINKLIRASSQQISDINIIKSSEVYETLPAALRETAELRLRYPEYSLQEIGESLSKPIGRSGVKRRFAKIAEIAAKVSGGGNIGK